MKKSVLQGLRLLVQIIFFLLIVCNVWAGFLDIWSALLMAIFFLTIVCGNFYCGWICPFGALQEWLGKLGSLYIKRKFHMPQKAAKVLQFSKYAIYAAILINGMFGFAESLSEIGSFNGNYNFLNLTSLLGSGTITTINLLAVVYLLCYGVASLFFDRPFCNYFCPDSIRYNLTSFLRVASVRRDKHKCVDCGKCDRACPMQIEVSACGKLRNANCINCMQCVSECPVKGALHYGV